MPVFLRQSTAVDVALGPFLDATDGVTAETALTIAQADVRLKKNNGNWAQVNDNTSAAHEENGWYEKELNTTDTDTVGRLLIAVHEAGALPVWHEFWVLEENVYDAIFAASAALGTDVASILTDTGTTLQGELDGIQADTEDIQSRLPAALVSGRIDASVGAMAANVMTAAAAAADLTTELQSGLATSAALTTVESKIDTIDTNVDGILADTGTDGVVVATNNDKTGYAIGAGGIANGAFGAGAIDSTALAANTVGASELAQDAARNVRSALRRLRNRVAIADGTATVYQENDSTEAWTADVTTSAGDPVSEVDPA